jgi:hypothetical protein
MKNNLFIRHFIEFCTIVQNTYKNQQKAKFLIVGSNLNYSLIYLETGFCFIIFGRTN